MRMFPRRIPSFSTSWIPMPPRPTSSHRFGRTSLTSSWNSPSPTQQHDPPGPHPPDTLGTKILCRVRRPCRASRRFITSSWRCSPGRLLHRARGNAGKGPPPPVGSGGGGLLAGRGPFFRCAPSADLGLLATGAAHGSPSSPGRHLPPAAGGPSSSHLRSHGRRDLDRGRPDHDSGRGAPGTAIMERTDCWLTHSERIT